MSQYLLCISEYIHIYVYLREGKTHHMKCLEEKVDGYGFWAICETLFLLDLIIPNWITFLKRIREQHSTNSLALCAEGRGREAPPAVVVWGGRAGHCPEGALALGAALLHCAAPALPGLACSGLEWIKQAVGKVPLICITSRQPCRPLCWQEITVFVTFSQGPPFGRDGPCDHA